MPSNGTPSTQPCSTQWTPPSLNQIIITGSGEGIERAVSKFTNVALGLPLDALQDKTYEWERKPVVVILEKLKTIYGSLRDGAF